MWTAPSPGGVLADPDRTDRERSQLKDSHSVHLIFLFLPESTLSVWYVAEHGLEESVEFKWKSITGHQVRSECTLCGWHLIRKIDHLKVFSFSGSIWWNRKPLYRIHGSNYSPWFTWWPWSHYRRLTRWWFQRIIPVLISGQYLQVQQDSLCLETKSLVWFSSFRTEEMVSS